MSKLVDDFLDELAETVVRATSHPAVFWRLGGGETLAACSEFTRVGEPLLCVRRGGVTYGLDHVSDDGMVVYVEVAS